MRYLAELEGPPHILESLAPCLQSDNVRLRKVDQRWALESSAFDQCSTGQEVFPLAEALLSRVHSVMAIYLGLHEKFSVVSVLWLNAEGILFRRSLRETITLRVFSSEGLRKLAALHKGEPLASVLVHRAATNERLREALSLVAERPLQWALVYDIIEFLGGIEEIVNAGWATDAETRRVRRTANYHRHLGKRHREPPPPNPPTLAQAGAFAFTLLKQWIATVLDDDTV
jgi:hypothetical protein